MGYGGWLCRRSTRRFVGNRRGPQRLTSTPVGAHERLPNRRGPQRLDLKPPWATVNGCQNYKILKPSYIFAKWFKKIILLRFVSTFYMKSNTNLHIITASRGGLMYEKNGVGTSCNKINTITISQ
jgi:hypothetical protein